MGGHNFQHKAQYGFDFIEIDGNAAAQEFECIPGRAYVLTGTVGSSRSDTIQSPNSAGIKVAFFYASASSNNWNISDSRGTGHVGNADVVRLNTHGDYAELVSVPMGDGTFDWGVIGAEVASA